MGIFDIFNRRKTDSAIPQNELEKSLLEATSNATARKEFYQKLLWNQLYVMTANQSELDENNTPFDTISKVSMVVLNDGRIPAFTSIDRIFDKGIIQRNTPYFSIKGQALFEAVQGVAIILNPFSEFGKELAPEEIESILNGTIYDQVDKYEIHEKSVNDFNVAYERAGLKQKGLIYLEGYKRKSLSRSDINRLEESIADYRRCLDIFPGHWQSMVLMAKSFQRLGRHEESLELLESAFKIELENHTIPMEASLEAMHLKDFNKALFYSAESIKRKPNDFNLMGNHAMNLLIAGKDSEAKYIIEEALRINPNDSVNRNIKVIIHEVTAGNRARPSFDESIM